MNQTAFSNMLDKILAMFGRNPTGAMAGICWDVCSALPDVFADYAVDQSRDLDKMPGNLSKYLRDCWFRWREAHPSMSAKMPTWGCEFCQGGTITFVRQRDGYGWLPETTTCGHCRPAGHTHREIRANGGDIVNPSAAMSLCVERNGITLKSKRGENFSARLLNWKMGENPEEREPIIGDERQDYTDGWI